MAELLPQERLQPSLLDRLTDDEPSLTAESRERRVLSMTRLRESVLRDVTWLLNTVQLGETDPLDDYPEVENSVVNYGVPVLIGTHVMGRDIGRLQEELSLALKRFEPRILQDSLTVRVDREGGAMSRRALAFTIEGHLWAQPVPQSLYLRTELDLETGAVRITDQGR